MPKYELIAFAAVKVSSKDLVQTVTRDIPKYSLLNRILRASLFAPTNLLMLDLTLPGEAKTRHTVMY